jgi:hypothetical protein
MGLKYANKHPHPNPPTSPLASGSDYAGATHALRNPCYVHLAGRP